MRAEGIFRISGSKKRQEELKHLLDKDIEINFEKDAFTEHDVASILKYYLAELPEPIITSAHINVHMQISGRDQAHFGVHIECVVGSFKLRLLNPVEVSTFNVSVNCWLCRQMDFVQ